MLFQTVSKTVAGRASAEQLIDCRAGIWSFELLPPYRTHASRVTPARTEARLGVAYLNKSLMFK